MTTDQISITILLPFSECSINGIVWSVAFCDWCLSFIIFLRFSHVVACIKSWFIFIAKYSSIVWVYHNLFIWWALLGFAELLESVGWGLSSLLEYSWRSFFSKYCFCLNLSLLFFWDSYGSFATAFDWVPTSLLLCAVLSPVFLSVLQFGSSLLISTTLYFFQVLEYLWCHCHKAYANRTWKCVPALPLYG